MAVPTNTFLTYATVGGREDLVNIIYNVDPEDTPFVTSLETVPAEAVNHEWQTDSYAAAVDDNEVLEGDDASTDAATATVRLGNICVISDKVAQVSTTNEAIRKAGREDELGYQMVKKSIELRRDIEKALFANRAKRAGDSSTTRRYAAMLSWIKTNTSKEASGADPTAADGTGTRTDGTQRAFTEDMLKAVLGSCWDNGGDPDTIYVGRFNKQEISGFTGGASRTADADDRTIHTAIDVYESDFGELTIVPNRFMRSRDCLVVESEMFAIAALTWFQEQDLAVTGLSRRKQIWCEYTLESRNEKASGGVFDLTTS